MNKQTRSSAVSVDANGRLHGSAFSSNGERWLRIALFLIPAIILLLKLTTNPAAALIRDFFSLTTLPAELTSHVERLILMSLGAVFVVVFRVTLGLRVLGPVRPILIALAFQLAGPVVATTFLIAVFTIIAVVRPILKTIRLPYFARIATVLSLVAMMILTALKLSLLMGADSLLRIGLLPVVVLTFAAEGFAKTLYLEGMKSAIWRALVTVVAAGIINLVSNISALKQMVLQYPEILLAQMGAILVIARHFNFRALQSLNPKVKRNPKKAKRLKRRAKRNSQKKRIETSN